MFSITYNPQTKILSLSPNEAVHLHSLTEEDRIIVRQYLLNEFEAQSCLKELLANRKMTELRRSQIENYIDLITLGVHLKQWELELQTAKEKHGLQNG